MNTFDSISKFIIPPEICDETDRHLQDAGRDGNECFVLWSGVIESDCFICRTIHIPKQTAYQLPSGLCVRVEADELHRLNVWLYENDERLGVQVHTHPTEAYHSDTDDAFPMVTTLGGLSLVVPDFCQFGVRGQGTALYRLTKSGWGGLSADDARQILHME
ncbi:MAG: hypothetical protein OXC42_08600 [Gammaproteobacteria bacterium]|nr:hypothetical protein [Gammaproteobacteria bacterium]